MVDVFLCHAPAERDVAVQIGARLGCGSEASVWLEPCGRDTQQTMVAAWDGGMSSTAILLLFSTNSIPQTLPIPEWQSLLKHIDGNAPPGVGIVLLDACPFPKLLERKRFYRWSDGPNEVLRKIEQWLIALHRDEQPSCVPAALPWFRGRERELSALWPALVDNSSTVVLLNKKPLSGKSALAQEFARVSSAHFRDIVWHGCGGKSPVAIAGDLRKFLPHHRELLVLDDLVDDLPAVACEQDRASILITTRRQDLNFPAHARVIEIASVEPVEQAEWPSDLNEAKLLEGMSVCRPQAVPLELAARIAGLHDADAAKIADRMAARRCIDPLEATGTYFRMIHGIAPTETLRLRHAQELYKAFADWRKNPGLGQRLLGEVETAFEWALPSDWHLATRLAAHAFAFLRAEERLPQAVQLYSRLCDAARERNDMETVKDCSDELSWISDTQGSPRSLYVTTDQLSFEFV